MEIKDDFKFYISDVDILKSEGKKPQMKIRGIASTNDEDSDGEMLDVNGMDLSNFKWINWNHKGSEDAGAVIGEVLKAEILNNNSLYIEGVLFPDVDMARHVYKLMKSLKNSKRGNKLSLSVEGNVVQRDPINENRVSKSRITAVAVCPIPVNGSTWADLLSKGYTESSIKDKAISVEGNQEITKESVEGTDNEKDEEKEDEKNKKSIIKKLSKSEVYSNLYDYFYTANKEKPDLDLVKSAYNLVQKIVEMKNSNSISQEDIKKAMDILDIAKSEDKNEEIDFEKAKSMVKAYMEEDDNREEDEDKFLEKASSFLKSKGYSSEVVNKACKEALKEFSKDTQGGGVTGKGDLKKSEKEEIGDKVGFVDLVKSINSFHEKTHKKTDELIDLVKSQENKLKEFYETIKSQEEVMKSQSEFVGEMRKRIEKVENTAKPQKSIVKSHSERFNSNGNEEIKKSFNIKDSNSRRELVNYLADKSGMNSGEGIKDKELATIASNIEISKSVDSRSLTKLKNLGIEVTS